MSIIGELYFEVSEVACFLYPQLKQLVAASAFASASTSALSNLMSFNTINLSLLVSVAMGQDLNGLYGSNRFGFWSSSSLIAS